jgi:hypothetical protein
VVTAKCASSLLIEIVAKIDNFGIYFCAERCIAGKSQKTLAEIRHRAEKYGKMAADFCRGT